MKYHSPLTTIRHPLPVLKLVAHRAVLIAYHRARPSRAINEDPKQSTILIAPVSVLNYSVESQLLSTKWFIPCIQRFEYTDRQYNTRRELGKTSDHGSSSREIRSCSAGVRRSSRRRICGDNVEHIGKRPWVHHPALPLIRGIVRKDRRTKGSR